MLIFPWPSLTLTDSIPWDLSEEKSKDKSGVEILVLHLGCMILGMSQISQGIDCPIWVAWVVICSLEKHSDGTPQGKHATASVPVPLSSRVIIGRAGSRERIAKWRGEFLYSSVLMLRLPNARQSNGKILIWKHICSRARIHVSVKKATAWAPWGKQSLLHECWSHTCHQGLSCTKKRERVDKREPRLGRLSI